MQKQIKLKNQEIKYSVRKSRLARYLRLAIYRDGSLIATMPRGASEFFVEKFIREKADWILKKIEFFKNLGVRPVQKISREDFLKQKTQVLKLIQERVDYYNKILNFSFKKIAIKNNKSRWGSCSRKGNLNFNFKLIFLSLEVVDYVVVHELAHLGEFNHSKKFWRLVASALPDYRARRKELKDNSLLY
jgi:predicted metal-dependent hydrolase